MARRTIEKNPSQTAAYTCFSRACAHRESDERFRGPDNIAEVFLPFIAKYIFLGIPFLRNFLMKRVAPPGIYEYVLARTKLIDEVFIRALDDDFTQIVLMGAGYDTRAIRFYRENNCAEIYELDILTTQQTKIKILKKKGVRIPEELIFVPIDFIKEEIPDVLSKAGFKQNMRTLFLWEGVTMYLTADAVDSTLDFIRTNSAEDSIVVFDYVYKSVLRGEKRYYGEKEIVKTVSRAGEGWTFGIEDGEIEDFLSKHGLKLVTHNTASDLEKKYLTADDGTFFGHINGTHCIVTASVVRNNI